MGCASSKIDDLPAVALCRDRLGFLDQALHQRYAFAEAHVAYIHSLKSIGVSLHRFFDSGGGVHPPPSPRKGGDNPAAAPAAAAVEAGPATTSGHLSHSNSGSHESHLHFNSDSDSDSHHHHHEDDSGSDGSLHHDSHPSSPSQHHRMMMYGAPDGFNPYPVDGGGGYNMQMNYMRRHVTPSVSYQQKPISAETVQFGEPSSSSSYNYPAHPFYAANQMPNNNNPSSYYDNRGNYGDPYGYMNYGAGPNFGSSPPGGVEGGWGAMASSSSSKPTPPPPPPPPPSTSSWDFLNLFESIENNNYQAYTPSLDSREVREEEGIPDLEDEDYEHEVVKEVHGNQKLVEESGGGGDAKSDSKRVEEEVVVPSEGGGAHYTGRPSVSSENNPVEYEVHMVDKKVVGGEGKSEQQGKGSKAGFRNVFEVVKEIQVQFERASASGSEIDKVLEVGKLRYHRKNAAYQASSKMLKVITPSLPSTSKDSEVSLDPDEDVQLRSVNLSASLQKLYLWEKKLFEEVKAEEKMRVLHDRKLQKLKHLDERGAESHKIESTRSVVRNLSTKIRIAIQIVDKISVKINKVRDEEFWPQLNELIQGLSRMWKAMLECHHSQCQAIDGAGGLDAIAFPKNPSDTHLEATLQLEHDLINWTCRFTEWVGAQKGFVRALNSWLFKCINTEPEQTADGVAPFSPGRAGAPPVFVICNQWNQSLERISETSEKEVVDSMRVFAMMVWHFRERDKGEMRQRMTTNRDMERKVKNMEREDMKMQKEIQGLDKKMLLSSGGSDGLSLSGHVVYQSDTSSKTSLQGGLLHIFEAMDRFTADSVKVYEELLQRTDEVVREHGRVL